MNDNLSEDMTPAATTSTPKSVHKTSPSKALGWVNFLLILIIAGVVTAGAWYGWQHHLVLLQQLATLDGQQQQQRVDQHALQTQVSDLQKQTSTLLQQQQALQQQADYSTEQIAQLAGADQQDWLLAEAEYLLRLANQRLQLEHDWGSALAMLQAADQVLVETNSPNLSAVRAHLAGEMLALRQAPALDIQGAVLRLQSLQTLIPQLPWLPEKLEADASAVATTAVSVSDQPWYQRFWHKVTDSLVGLVRIRERNHAFDAPLSPRQQYYLQQNMYLMLEQAQVAILREETALYQHSLERVSAWLQHYLILGDSKTQAMQQGLQELLQWPVAPVRPDISASLLALQKLTSQRRRVHVEGGGL